MAKNKAGRLAYHATKKRLVQHLAVQNGEVKQKKLAQRAVAITVRVGAMGMKRIKN